MAELTLADVFAWLESLKDFKPVPVGNQPDEFLLGIMKRPIKDGEKPTLELDEDMTVPEDYEPEKK